MTSVLVYTRLSTADRTDAIERQETACLAYAEARGWTVTGTIGDEGASAYDRLIP